MMPLSHWERQGPAAKRWEGEGDALSAPITLTNSD